MKPGRPITSDYLLGKWQIIAFYLNTDCGWKLTKRYAPDSFLWEFGPDGAFTESRDGSPVFQTGFTLSAGSKELFIDRTGFEKENILSLNSRYEIVPIHKNECLIYDIESKSEKPGICKYRMKLKRTPHPSIK